MDSFRLQRFIDAQQTVFTEVIGELTQGRKQSHWMWFIFPQIVGLGQSETAELYAIQSLAEARAYLDHALLGSRLHQCTHLVRAASGRSAFEIFGMPDTLKFRSSMTLFSKASSGENEFAQALDLYFDGEDEATLQILASAA